MKLLAIDPGNEQSAYVFINVEPFEIVNTGIVENHEFMGRMDDVFANYHLAIEMIASYGMPVGKSIFETCLWVGRFIERSNSDYTLVYRKDIKMHFCGSMRAKDSNIRQALLDRLGKEVCKGIKKDIWSALAVALYYLDTHKELSDWGIK